MLSSNRQIQLKLNLSLLLIPPTQPLDQKSRDLAGIQQNLLSNIDTHSKADLKTALKKFEVVFQPENFEVVFQNFICCY